MIGYSISHYKILEKLGSGGMGIVYKAEDIKLQRVVALKFLPSNFSISTEDKLRLLNEAQMAARLNHPHICTIYDISDEDDEKFIVMEFVDGITLREKIKSGGLSIEESIEFAIQIGSALEEAHSKGIIHRDIKPDNIMINSKNQIKVMDFGIAKLKEGLGLTKTMSTSGTVAYMAPEQLSNSGIDGRVDIFSLGILLYEMLTSRFPFRGEHQAAMMYSIMNEEPEPISKYILEVPSELIHILNRALEKDPEDRYQNVHDLVIDLRRLKKHTHIITHPLATSEHINVKTEQIPKPLQPVFRSKRKILLITILATLLLCAAVVIFFIPRGPQINPNMTTRTIQLPFKNVYRGAMSKDGNWVVFSAEDDSGKINLYMMNLAQGLPKKIISNSKGRIGYSGLSPDANTILFTRFNEEKNYREIVSVSSAGGNERVVVEKGGGPEWRDDGKRFMFYTTKMISQNRRIVNYCSALQDGSDKRIEIADTFKTWTGYRVSCYYSPDGNSIVRTKNYSGGYCEIVTFDTKSKTNRQLTFDKKFADDPCWSPNGQIIYSSDKTGNVNLWVVSATGGESVQLTRGSGHDVRSGFSSDGKRFLYAETREGIGQIFCGNIKDGTYRQITSDDRQRSFPTISNNTEQIAFIAQELTDVSNIWNIYIMNIDGSNLHRITEDNMYKSYPYWSSDDRWLIYSASLPGQSADSMRIYFVRTDNSTPPQTIGYGSGPLFLNEKEFIFHRSMTTYKGDIESRHIDKISEDSLTVIPMIKSEYVYVRDNHVSKIGLYVGSTDTYRKYGLKGMKQIYKGMFYSVWFTDKEIYYLTGVGKRELRKVTLPDCKDVKVDLKFPGINPYYDLCASKDGKTIVYANQYNTAKYVVIDNLFKQ